MRYFRCQSCAKGASVEHEVDDTVIAVIAPCPEVFERGNQKIQCRGPMVHRAYREGE